MLFRSEAGAGRLVAYQKFLRRGDISLTHTIVQPTVAKAAGDAPPPGNPYALRNVADPGPGILVPGPRPLAPPAPLPPPLALSPPPPAPPPVARPVWGVARRM